MKAQMFLLTTCFSLAAADLGVISPRHGIMLNTETTRPDFQHFQVELKPADATNIVTLTITNSLLTIDDLARLPSGRVVMGLKSYFWDGSVSDLAIYTFDLRRADPPAPSAARAVISAGSEPPKSLINELQRRKAPFWNGLIEPPMPPFSGIGHPHHYFSTNIAGWRSTNIAELLSRTNPITWNPADYTNQEPDTRVSTEVFIRFGTNIVPEGLLRSVPPLPDATFVGIDPTIATNLAYCWYNLATNVECQSTNHGHDVTHWGRVIWKAPKPLPGATNQTYAQYLDWLADRKGKRRNE